MFFTPKAVPDHLAVLIDTLRPDDPFAHAPSENGGRSLFITAIVITKLGYPA